MARRSLVTWILAALGLAATAGCDPTPTFPVAAQPLPGVVLLERAWIAAAGVPLDVSIWMATLHIPADAVAPGTRVLVRYLGNVRKTLAGGDDTNLWSVQGQPAAVQILPETLSFAAPAMLTVNDFYSASQGSAVVLSAAEADGAWQTRGPAGQAPSPGLTDLTAVVDGPHLWSFAWLKQTLPEPRGAFVQQLLTCNDQPVNPIPADTLTLGEGSYLWTRVGRDGACGVVETGTFTLDVAQGTAVFTPSGGAARRYGLQVAVNGGFYLEGQYRQALDCPPNQAPTQWFEPVTTTTDGGPATGDVSDGGCPADATEGGDARTNSD